MASNRTRAKTSGAGVRSAGEGGFQPGWTSSRKIAPLSGTIGSRVVRFVHEVRFGDLPASVAGQAGRCVLDLLGTAAGAVTTPLSRLIRDHAACHFGSPDLGARILFDGRRVSPVGAALAGGMTIDSLDCHDGHALTTGHAGAAILPALVAYLDAGREASGQEFLTSVVVGYEVATRAGIALHRTASDYHASGAWNALACAALGARLLGLGSERTRHALGIAEYHGPRSPAMRCIDHPTMVKDGSGWGAMAGVSAAYLAAAGFTGAPAVIVEGAATEDLWVDLGERWRILEQYAKPYPVCRWAQPAVEAALALQRMYDLTADAIDRVEVTSFHEATRLATRRPTSTEEAQYSLPFPVAAALVRGRLGSREVSGDSLSDPEILRLSSTMVLEESDEYSGLFPAERWARVKFVLRDGHVVVSAPATARGDPDNPLTDDEFASKFRALAAPTLGLLRAAAIEHAVAGLAGGATDTGRFLDDILCPAIWRAE